MFNDAGISAAVLLSDTPRAERNAAIGGFKKGRVKVLVNVLIATEGFDLPDAACILIARPTMSLAIYLQMVGRGLRRKPDNGNCIILDLAGNSEKHGLPEKNREWSLEPRGKQDEGKEAPVVWCEKCLAASPAASHHCRNRECNEPFGKDCKRCGKWRAWKRWEFENHCGDAHELVCDLCHIDAHIQAHLPVEPPLDKLVDICDDREVIDNDFKIDDDLANRLLALFKELLESERKAIVGADDARRRELRQLIEQRESVLNDGDQLDALFNKYIDALPETKRPQGRAQESRAFVNWEDNLRAERDKWRSELKELESRKVNKQAIFNSARIKAMHLLQKKAKDMGLWEEHKKEPENGSDKVLPPGKYKLSKLGDIVSEKGWKPLARLKPSDLQFPNGNKGISSWKEMYTSVVVWLFKETPLSPDGIPSELKKFFRPEEWLAPQGYLKTTRLPNRLFLVTALDAGSMIFRSCRFIRAVGEDPARFQVQLR